MAFTPFTKDDQPTMAAFNEKFSALLRDSNSYADNVAEKAKNQALAQGVQQSTITALTASIPKVASGEYTGSAAKSTTINIGFRPKFVAISGDGEKPVIDGGNAVWVGQSSEKYGDSTHSYTRSFSVSDTGITISGSYAEGAMSVKNTVYYWFAIG